MGCAVLRAEHGIALPLVLSVMLLVSTLAVAALGGALATSTSSNADQRGTRAFAAAEGGVDAALFRLTRVTPAPAADECLTTLAVASDGDASAPRARRRIWATAPRFATR